MTTRGIKIIGLLGMPAVIICLTLNASAAGTDAGSASVPIEAIATVMSSYAVKANPYLELTWNEAKGDYEGIYQVDVRGCIPENQKIRIVPDTTFQMSAGEVTRTGTVQQSSTTWAMAPESADILPLSERVYVNATGCAAIDLPGTAVYHGGIDFTFSVE